MLDDQIKNIFSYLIYSKLPVKVDYNNRSLIYKIDDKKVCLYMYKGKPESNSYSTIDSIFELCTPRWIDCDINSETVNFRLGIEGKWYTVPELDRVAYAKALNRIEQIIVKYEKDNLNSITTALMRTDTIPLLEVE